MGEQVIPHAVVVPVRRAERLAAAGLHREGGRRPAPGDAGGAAAAAPAGRLGRREGAAQAAALRDPVSRQGVRAHTAGTYLIM